MKALLAAILVLLLAGCAAQKAADERQTRMEREMAVERMLLAGEQARGTGNADQAELAYRQALALDPGNARAAEGVEAAGRMRRHRGVLAEAERQLRGGDADGALARAKEVLAEDPANREARALARRVEEPRLRAAAAAARTSDALKKPITIGFRDAPVRSVFEFIARHTGLNFILDRDIAAEDKTTVFVRNTSTEDVIRFILTTSRLESKLLNETTFFIYPNTPAKTKDHKDLVMRSFYLANASAKQTAEMVKALVKTNDLYVDEKLNLLVIRDTPEAVGIAEKLIANQDQPEPEVMLEVEVMELGASIMQQLGVQWADRLAYGVIGAAGIPGTISLTEWLNRNSSLVRMTLSDPFLAVNLKKQDGRTAVLANPRIRVKNNQKARVHIGDKVPVITTTSTSTGFVAESTGYLDVGLKLEVEPTVYLENDVGIKVALEVSSIIKEVRTQSGSLSYQVGTRNTATTLQLRDGETQVLAGLINDDDRRGAAKVPGLGDLPVLGRLFSSHDDNSTRTEIVLLITPRVLRNIARPHAAAESFGSGPDASIGAPAVNLPAAPAR